MRASRTDVCCLQVEAFRQDAVRIIHENNRLHQQQLAAADVVEQQSRQHYKATKASEGEISALKCWKQSILQRFVALEKENGDLKTRLREADSRQTEGPVTFHVLLHRTYVVKATGRCQTEHGLL